MSDRQYFPVIDGLRALAVLTVIFFHLEIDFFQGGFVGVDVFFVISGYLITRNIIIYNNLGIFSFKKFYLSRVRRLFPAMLVTILLTMFCCFLLFSPDTLIRTADSSIASTLSFANIRFWRVFGYFDLDASVKPLLHFWSLSVEEQFYIIWPLILILLIRNHGVKLKLLIIISIGSLLSLLAVYFVTLHDPHSVFFLVQYRVYEFGLGALLITIELLFPIYINNRLRSNSIFSSLGICAILYAAVTYDKDTVYPGFLPCLGALLILSTKESLVSALFLKNKVMLYTGKVSYSLYLVHWPIWVFASHWWFYEFTVLQKGIVLFIIFISGSCLYFFIEQKFRYEKTVKSAVSQKFVYISILLLMVIILLTALLIRQNDGFPSRISSNYVAIADSQVVCEHIKAKEYNKRFLECEFGDKENKSNKILVIGDSHAYSLRHALDSFGLKNNIAFHSVVFAGCPPFTNVALHRTNVSGADKGCLIYSEKLKELLSSDEYGAVFIANRWMWYYEHDEYFFRNDLPKGFLLDKDNSVFSSESSRTVWKKHLSNLTSQLSARSIKVVVFSQQPLLSKRIGQCDKSPSYLIPVKTHLERCEVKIPYVQIMKRVKFTNEYISSLETDSVMVVRPSEYLCDQNKCIVFNENGVLYHDDNHLNTAGTFYLLESVEDELNDFLTN